MNCNYCGKELNEDGSEDVSTNLKITICESCNDAGYIEESEKLFNIREERN